MIVPLRVDAFGPVFFGLVALLLLMAAPILVITSSGEFNFLMAGIVLLLIIAGLSGIDGYVRGDYETELEIADSGLITYMKNGEREAIEYKDMEGAEVDYDKWGGEIVRIYLGDDADSVFRLKDEKSAESVAAEIRKRIKRIKEVKRFEI